MLSAYQRQSLKALLELFLRVQGAPLPDHSQLKSASALSRFLTVYSWSVRQAIRRELKRYRPRGRRPHPQVILDMTTLEKRGKFKAFADLITVFHGKRGVHGVVLYLVVGPWRVPWSFRVYRGKGQPSVAQLGLRLVRQLPKWLKRAFKLRVLADTAFGPVDFLKGIRQLKLYAITGVRYDRKLNDGRQLFHLHKPGQPVRLSGLDFPVTVAWFYLKRDGQKKRSQRFVLSTEPLKASTIVWWGRHRWQIEGFFKTAKHRFGLHRFGQQTLLGLYRWLVLSLVAFVLAHWGYLSMESQALPDWAEAAAEVALADVLMALLLADIERRRPLLQQQGIEIHVTRCKM
ncbi:IS701 family transposase [filamentous cyanobacterium CCP5]|nr:IS701 family transposase [filamentous cyanobacterium CCP5]